MDVFEAYEKFITSQENTNLTTPTKPSESLLEPEVEDNEPSAEIITKTEEKQINMKEYLNTLSSEQMEELKKMIREENENDG